MLQGDTGIAATNSTATAYHFSYDPSPPSPKNYPDPNVEKVNQQLAKLKAVLNQPPEKQGKSMVTAEVPVQPNTSISSPDIHRLENIVQSMHQKDSSADPEMEQLNGMMDKLLDIQHPERVKERIREQSQKNKQQVFPVVVNSSNDNISLLQSNAVPSVQQDSIPPVKDTLVATVSVLTPNAFYSLDDTNNGSDEKPNAVEAVVQETQTLVSGATVKLRLMSEVYINGVLIPKDNFIYGMASLNGERLNISITTIRYQNNILPVALSVYDMDGLSGIYIPGAITRDVAKQSADESLQGIGLTTLDPSLSAQAASAGIQAAKTLISKKVKLVRVTVKAGYRVLLRDTNQK
jgi:conjugative transposon TraM protein